MNEYEEIDYTIYKLYLDVTEAIATASQADEIAALMALASKLAEAYAEAHKLIK